MANGGSHVQTHIFFLCLTGSASSSTITLTGAGTYTAGPTATYQEKLTANLPSLFPIMEEKSACGGTVLAFGTINCEMGSFAFQFPQIVIPSGYAIQRSTWLSLTLGLVPTCWSP